MKELNPNGADVRPLTRPTLFEPLTLASDLSVSVYLQRPEASAFGSG